MLLEQGRPTARKEADVSNGTKESRMSSQSANQILPCISTKMSHGFYLIHNKGENVRNNGDTQFKAGRIGLSRGMYMPLLAQDTSQ
jgi:hypothetical protein